MNPQLSHTPPGTALVHPAARQLLTEVATHPGNPLRLAVAAPGGYGKTTVLTALGRSFRDAGVDAVLIDDADRLDEDGLAKLVELAGLDTPRLVLAHRPGRLPATLRSVIEGFGRETLVLTALTQGEVRLLVENVTGRPATAGLAAEVHALTGGVPRFVERVAAGRTAEFRGELAELDEDVLHYLIAAEAGAGRNLDLLCALLDCDRDRLPAVFDGARATGLLGENDVLLPVAADAVRTHAPAARRLTVLQRLVELQLRDGLPVLDLAKSLLDTGSSGTSAAAAFEAAAGEALAEDAKLAVRLFEAAAEAGGRGSSLSVGWATAAALSGDLDTALRLGDSMLSGADPEARAAGAEVAATVLAHRGELARSAELYQWSGRGSAPAFAAIALLGTGDPAGARRLLDTPAPGAVPTLFAGAAARMAHGVVESVSDGATETLSTLLGAAAMLEPAGTGAPLPDSPAALAALVALHSGELALAESVLKRALDNGIGGDLLAARHRLLLGWVAMTAGDLTTAAAHRDAVAAGPLEARDELFFATLELGLARRASDLLGLQRGWDRAYQASMRQQTDLFTLLPLGELAIAAARVGAHPKLTRQLDRAQALLADLGDPPLWTASLHWSRLHAAITLEDHEAAETHLAALTGLAPCGRYDAALAEAARGWLAVLSGEFDPDEISATAAELHGFGLCWDAARLAGQAAIRTSDRKAMVLLLEAARQFQGAPGRREPSGPESVGTAGLSALSERELEVARLVVDGLTYKQAGGKLFISGKTVEHHMARIRGKLGAGDRRELLATLRDLLGPTPGQPADEV
ncbi:helix-turn-helix transcriptional regulator [Amycolatopsis sp. H20-H5]|uniref:helix-turn-helix transcriptional regulator n=1 Tax=Amycolatopsis sp. H20-H5 TaxID=3046309 RepID=UPI002DBAC29F|nr:LuxR C-terminal-related transcriptional regulator [Amycolatopsis sp. H20-H5]MEC3977356.1 LuxR C-terminal-related transcriptional regulator [Amycolatopsis sp. H20-H5]